MALQTTRPGKGLGPAARVVTPGAAGTLTRVRRPGARGCLEGLTAPAHRSETYRIIRPPRRQGVLHDERGITGIETAIILISFIVVAAVFSFVVLSTGLFSSERGREAVYAGLSKARGSLSLSGGVIATSDGTELTDLLLAVTLAAGGEAVSLDPNAQNGRTLISYGDAGVIDNDLAYVSTEVVGDGDVVLEPGELFELSIDLTQNAAIDVRANETFWLEIKPPSGAYQVVQRTTPGSIAETVIDLN